MRALKLRLNLLWCLFRLGKNPERTDLVFDISDILFKMNAFHETTRRLSANSDFAEMAAGRKLMSEIDLQKLAQLPSGTLGCSYAKHMLDRGLKPDFYRSREIVNDATWSMMWLRQTHDLWHVATGFDTDAFSEVGLQAFMLTQLVTPLSALLISASLIKTTLKDPTLLGGVVSQIVRGVSLAKEAKPLFIYQWEENWEKPLSVVRQELSLKNS